MKAIKAPSDDEDDEEEEDEWEERPPSFAEKLRLYFDAIHPGIEDVTTQPVWSAGELLRFGGDFNKYVRTRDLTKQQGIIFRHLLRMILLCEEFAKSPPADVWPADWQNEFHAVASALTESCRAVDPTSTDEIVERIAEDLEEKPVELPG